MCDKKFTTIFNLRDHERRHLKNYTCYCPYCPEKTVGFYKQVYLNEHVKKAHGDASLSAMKSKEMESRSTATHVNNSGPSRFTEPEIATPLAQIAVPFRYEELPGQVPDPNYPCLSFVQSSLSLSLSQPKQYSIEG